MATIKSNNLVEKRNVLNELRSSNMTLQELRFFSIYLSKINARDKSTRVVRFPMDDFKAIMELGRIDINYMKNVTNRLLSKVVNVPAENGGYEGFQLFKKCKVNKDEHDEWYVQIDAHDDALPLMFEFKKHYFKYELWNALRLSSSNQLRMYELLKQYENAGERIVSVEDLKSLLGLHKHEYPRFGDFKTYVLNACQKALAEQTDIKFKYEPHGKKGAGGKIIALKFTIEKNEDYTDQICLAEFVEMMKQEAEEKENIEEKEPSRSDEIVSVYKGLDYGKNFAKLSNDEYLELNQTAVDYLMKANRTDELDTSSVVTFVGKNALYTNRLKPSKNYYTYILGAVKNNYAKA